MLIGSGGQGPAEMPGAGSDPEPPGESGYLVRGATCGNRARGAPGPKTLLINYSTRAEDFFSSGQESIPHGPQLEHLHTNSALIFG